MPHCGAGPQSAGGRIFPEFTVFILKNRDYLAQLSLRLTLKKFREQKASGGAKMAKGRQINVLWWEIFFWGVQKLQGAQQAYKKNNKVATFFCFVLETVKILYFVGAPFEFSGE